MAVAYVANCGLTPLKPEGRVGIGFDWYTEYDVDPVLTLALLRNILVVHGVLPASCIAFPMECRVHKGERKLILRLRQETD